MRSPVFFALASFALLCIYKFAWTMVITATARPQYDLLFSTDYNGSPYAALSTFGLVVRVQNQKARVIFTGKWNEGYAWDRPSIYILPNSVQRSSRNAVLV